MISLWSGEFASFLPGLHHQPPGSHVLCFCDFSLHFAGAEASVFLEETNFLTPGLSENFHSLHSLSFKMDDLVVCKVLDWEWFSFRISKALHHCLLASSAADEKPDEFLFPILCILFCFFFERIWGFLSHRFLQLCDSRSWCGIPHLLVSIHGGPLQSET